MIEFEVFGKRLCFKFGFFAVVALFCLIDVPRLALISAAACAVHEIGHIFAGTLLGMRIQGVTFWAGGIKMTAEKRIRPLSHDTAVLFAGPFFNFLAAAALYALNCREAAAVNAFLGSFNLLPFSELDGGSALRLIFESKLQDQDRFMRITAVLTGIAAGIFLLITDNGNVTAFFTLLILTVSEFLD